MSAKPKALLKHSRHKKKKEQKLETVDDYQAAGVDFEDAAGKWRAGDATKSMRFFQRALEVYENGLQRFPQSFDLAYNKARVELEIATHPTLASLLQQPVLNALQVALESHRYALTLNQDNADTLFNTSQVLTSIAEEIAKDDRRDDGEAVQFLEEALQLQDRCLSLQELKYEESIEQQQEHQTSSTSENVDEGEDDGGVSLTPGNNQEEQWFSIVEPVTRDTLIDTTLAQLGTLTTLCGILCNSPNVAPQAILASIEEYSTRLLSKKLPFFSKGQEHRLPEIALVKANFISALLEAGYRAGRIDSSTYKRERDGAFSVSELHLEDSAEALLANARSLMSYSTALADIQVDDMATTSIVRWNSLSGCITTLIRAAKLVGIPTEDLAKTHLLRGDCSMLQRQMGLPPVTYLNAVSNGSQLLKNAEVFYRNASKLSPEAEEMAIARVRSAVALYLQQGDKSSLASAGKGRSDVWLMEKLDDMILEGLLPLGFQLS